MILSKQELRSFVKTIDPDLLGQKRFNFCAQSPRKLRAMAEHTHGPDIGPIRRRFLVDKLKHSAQRRDLGRDLGKISGLALFCCADANLRLAMYIISASRAAEIKPGGPEGSANL
jgi:hypothetical protein